MRIIESNVEQYDMEYIVNKLFEGYKKLKLGDYTILYRFSYDKGTIFEVIYLMDKAIYEKMLVYLNPIKALRMIDYIEMKYYEMRPLHLRKFMRHAVRKYEFLVYRGKAYRNMRVKIRRWLDEGKNYN